MANFNAKMIFYLRKGEEGGKGSEPASEHLFFSSRLQLIIAADFMALEEKEEEEGGGGGTLGLS